MDLNYIRVRGLLLLRAHPAHYEKRQHYPKTKKYISIFPPEARDTDTPDKLKADDAASSKTDAERADIRDWIRTQMLEGKLSKEPELQDSEDGAAPDNWSAISVSKKRRQQPLVEAEVVEEEDAFFEDDDEEDES